MKTKRAWGCRGRQVSLSLVLGSGVLMFFCGPINAWSTEPADSYEGLREATRQYVAPGSPDELLRLRDALDRTEQEIARFRLEVPTETEKQYAEKQASLKEMKDRLAESQVLLQILERSTREVSNKQLDPLDVKERELLRKTLSHRNDELKKGIVSLEKEIGFAQAEHIRVLEEERKALARLLTVRKERLLSEYQGLAACATDDRLCLARKLKILCRLTPLLTSSERAPLLILLDEAAGQLSVGHASSSSLCEYLKHDFGL